MKNNTIIFTVRNRPAIRIEHLIQSLRKNNINSSVIIVDFGSDDENSKQYQQQATQLHAEYIKTETQGLPWSRAQALNIGIKHAASDYITTTDIDMLFETNPYEYITKQNIDDTIFHIQTYWLPQSGKKEKAKAGGKGAQGGFLFIKKTHVEKIGGYDERMLYWGQEDLDFVYRLQKIGCKTQWLPEAYRIYHQWHKASEGHYLRPETASYNTICCAYENIFTPILNTQWGKCIEKKDRPILNAIQSQKPEIIELETNELMKWNPDNPLLTSKEKGHFIKLCLQSRLKKRPFDCFRAQTGKILKPITALTGNRIMPNLNYNFDYVYALLPLLQKHGLQDYYIAKNFTEIFLLWE